MRTVPYSSLVGPFADRLLAHDLPGLTDSQRGQVVGFVVQRVAGLPTPTRVGVVAVAAAVRAALAVPGVADRAIRLLAHTAAPLLGEYPRLVRSLGYAYIWERWPDSASDGSRTTGLVR